MAHLTSVPFHELMGDNSPPIVLDLMTGLTSAALAANVDTIHPSEVVIGRGARVNLRITKRLPDHPFTSAPELKRTGPSSETLVYAVGALATMAALSKVGIAPADGPTHSLWLRDLRSRLGNRWGDAPGGEVGIQLITRCLARDPRSRPTPQELLDLVRTAGFAPEDGLVSRTGYAAPAMTDQLPEVVVQLSQTPDPDHDRRHEPVRPQDSQQAWVPMMAVPAVRTLNPRPAGTPDLPPQPTPERRSVRRSLGVVGALGLAVVLLASVLGAGVLIGSVSSSPGLPAIAPATLPRAEALPVPAVELPPVPDAAEPAIEAEAEPAKPATRPKRRDVILDRR